MNMMNYDYDYRKEMYDDVLATIKEHDLSRFEDIEEFEEKLNEDLYIRDSVTGSASGSYFCNSYAAEAAICHNLDILEEAIEEFGCDWNDTFKCGAEWADVTIRCYLLGEIIAAVLEDSEFLEAWEEAHKIPVCSFIESYENSEYIEEGKRYYLGELLDGTENTEDILELESVYRSEVNTNIDFTVVSKNSEDILKTVVQITDIWR